jgi:hypothetical protein
MNTLHARLTDKASDLIARAKELKLAGRNAEADALIDQAQLLISELQEYAQEEKRASGDTILWEGVIDGPRFAIASGWMDGAVVHFNFSVRKRGIPGRIELVSARESTTFIRRQIVYKISGPRNLVETFNRNLERMMSEYNDDTTL